LNARIAGAVARHESEHKADRMSRRRKQQAQQGIWGGGTRPFGWETDGVTPIPGEIVMIRRAYDIILAGGSLHSVVRMLNESGYRTTRSEDLWERQPTRLMLRRPRNAGLAVHKGVVQGPGQWDAVVSEDEWRAVARLH